MIVYFDGGGQTALSASWKGPGSKKEEIPSTVLSHEGKAMQPVGDAEFVVDQKKAALGAAYYVNLQCARCHGGLSPADAALPPVKPLAQLNARQPAGCLATKPKPGIKLGQRFF